jgi:hypothetical protein
MPTLVERLSNKIGPLPAWAWAAIPAAAYVAYAYYQAARAPSEGVEPLDDGSSYADDYGINPGGASLPGYSTTPSGSSNLPFVDPPRYDNTIWYKQASNYLISEGVSPVDIVTALNAYLYGFPKTINQTQMNALNKAITKFGAAPEGGQIPTVGTPTTPPKPPTVTVPDAPTNVRVGMANPKTARVAWGRPQLTGGSPIIGYKIESWQRNAAGTWQIRQTKLALATAGAIDFVVQPKQWYTFRVYARNVKGYGPHAYQSIRTP